MNHLKLACDEFVPGVIPQNVEIKFGIVWKTGNQGSHFSLEDLSIEDCEIILNAVYLCVSWYVDHREPDHKIKSPEERRAYDNALQEYTRKLESGIRDDVLDLSEARMLAEFRAEKELSAVDVTALHTTHRYHQAVEAGLRELIETEELKRSQLEGREKRRSLLAASEKTADFLRLSGLEPTVAQELKKRVMDSIKVQQSKAISPEAQARKSFHKSADHLGCPCIDFAHNRNPTCR